MAYLKEKKMPRPTSKTPEVISKIEEAASLGCSVEEMALASGVSRSIIYQWLEEDKEFSERIDDLRQNPFRIARQTIMEGIKTNPQWAFEYMKRKKKDEFSERFESTGKDGKDLPTPIIVLPKKEETEN